jgi:trans-aconitate 2-methyltransferase
MPRVFDVTLVRDRAGVHPCRSDAYKYDTSVTTTDSWDPRQYERFAAERSQPFYDLAALVRPLGIDGGRLVDLGCGQGNLTAELPALLGATTVLGIDNSPAMLADSVAFASTSVRFAHGDLAGWCEPGQWDVVFANAALQWVPDHAAVLGRWAESLRPGGQIAVQVPANFDHPAHVLIGELAIEEPYGSGFAGGVVPVDPVATNVLRPEQYAVLLDRLGFTDQTVRLQVYGHRLASSAEVVEWTKGTSLTRIKRALASELYDEFVDEYRRRLVATLGPAEPFFYPFKRILLWGRLP